MSRSSTGATEDAYRHRARHRATGTAIGTPATLLLVVAAHAALLALLYAQVADFGYAYYDDDRYVLLNPAVLAGLTRESIEWAFTSLYMSNWHPLSWLSHMLDVSLFGTAPGPAHLHNVLLHGMVSLLVFGLLRRYGAAHWQAALLSLVFLAHPLHIESVAWIAERKDLLCALFYLLALLAYDNYRHRPNVAAYVALTVSFVLALLAKPMAVTLPVILLLLDATVYCPIHRQRQSPHCSPPPPGARAYAFTRAAVRETLPLFMLSLAVGVVTLLAQDKTESVAALQHVSLGDRLQTAIDAWVIYLWQWFKPTELAVFYPHNPNIPLWRSLLFATVLLSLCALALGSWRRRSIVSAGIGWFFISLLPVIGLVQVGSQAHADRYMYLPSVGVLMACLPLLGGGRRSLAAVLSGLFLAYLSALCYWQVGYWSDEHTLFTRAAEVTGPNYVTHIHLAQAYERYQMPEMAARHGAAAIELRPRSADGYMAVGNAALALKQFAVAERYYRNALSLKDDLPVTLNNLAIAVAEQGRTDEAVALLERALAIAPERADTASNLLLYRARVAP